VAVAGGVAAIATWVLTRPAPLALGGDNETLHHPLFVDVLRQLRAGIVPLWTTGRWGGSPLAGDPVLGATYPANYLGYLLTDFPHARAIDVAACVHLAVFATGMLWCCGRLGVRPALGLVATALAVANPALVYVARSWINWWGAIAWWPWLFGAALGIGRDGRGIALGSVSLAAQIYAGYPQYALHSGLAAIVLVLAAPGRPWSRRIVDAVLAVGGGVGLALPQLLPGLAMAAESVRRGPGGAASLAALDVAALGGTAWLDVLRATPTLGVLPCKLAPVVLLLALVGVCDRRTVVRALALLAAGAAVLATGPAPLMRVLHGLPLFDFFAGPFKFFYLFAVLAHLLAAVGLERIATARAPWAGRGGTVAAIVALFAGAVFVAQTGATTTPQPFARDAFTPLLRMSPVDPAATGGDHWLALDEADDLRQTGMNFGGLWGVRSMSGVGPLPPWRELAVLGGAERGRAVDLAREVGASRIVVRASSPLAASFAHAGYGTVAGLDGLVVLAAPSRPLHAFLVARARTVDAAEAIAAARRGSAFDADEILVEGAGGADEEGDARGRLDITERRQHLHGWRVGVRQPTWLAVREPYYRNWVAAIDGRPAEVRPAGGFFVAVRVPAGEHEVALRYREPGLVPGIVAAGVSVLMLGVVAARRSGTVS
jgi:hypothetical protein